MITDSNGKIIQGSIASLERIKIGGVKQTVLIRSKSINNPVLLILHGGPGSSEMAAFRHYNSKLEDYFIVVNWDQRGAGKSYSPFIDKKTMNISQFVSDTIELANLLKNRFNKEKIYLLGHSWGSGLGIRAVEKSPELFYAYIGVGQIVNMVENEKLSYKFTLEKAKELKDDRAIKELSSIKNYPWSGSQGMKYLMTERRWLAEFGGVLYGEKGYGKMFSAFKSPEVNIFDLFLFFSGSYFSINNMWQELVDKTDFLKTSTSLKVPVYFMIGKHDYNVPFELSEKYFNILKAPKKELIWL